jgi:NTP pyrophosphatase (non-canonical NTP hydrolase)
MESMTFNEYQKIAKTTAVYPDDYRMVYPTLGLTGEAGEVAEKVKKYIRDGCEPWLGGEDSNVFDNEIKKELGDVLWYLSAIASDLDISLEDVARTNLKKLESRLERDMIKGSGDNR